MEEESAAPEQRRHTLAQELARLESPVMRAAHLDQSWRDEASCAEEKYEPIRDYWFAPDNTYAAAAATDICGACPARKACLEWACESRQQYGIYGGLTPAVRRAKIVGMGVKKAHDYESLVEIDNVYDTVDPRSRFYWLNLKQWKGEEDEDE